MNNHGFKVPCQYLIACKEQREQKAEVERRKDGNSIKRRK